MERRRMRIPLRNQDRPAYPSSRILLGSRLPRWRKIFRPDEEQKIARASMWFLSSGDCLLRATLKKKEEKKERRKKKRTEGCRKNRLACSCAQQHVPRILEKLDIPQSSASRMSSREIYKGLRASLPGASATM